MSMTLPQRVSLSITGTFNFFCASFCSSCLTIEYPSRRCGLPQMYLTTLWSLPTAPNDLHFFRIFSLLFLCHACRCWIFLQLLHFGAEKQTFDGNLHFMGEAA